MTDYDQPSITCPRCGRTSYSQGDIDHGYCGWCHWWTSDPAGMLNTPEAIAQAERDRAITPMPERRRRAARSRHHVQIALTTTFLVMAVNFAIGHRGVALISGTAWLTCFVIYRKMRRLERSLPA